MKRDMDLVRTILEHCEKGTGQITSAECLNMWRNSDEVIHHVRIMADGGLLMPLIAHIRTKDGLGVVQDHQTATAHRITWKGHDFLDATRQPERWSRVKEIAAQAGGVSFQVLLDLARKLTWEAVRRQMGM